MDPNGGGEAPSPRPEGRLARLRRAPATTALLVALAVAFVASSVDPSLVYRFAKDDARIRDGEVWRLFTASLLHGGIAHLAVNGLALYAIGPTVEQLYGRAWLLVVFLVGGAVGFAASAVLVAAPSLGASAGLFALLGLLLAFPVRARERLARRTRRAMTREILMIAGLNLALGFMLEFVDNAAHLGGFAAGFTLGLCIRPRELP